MDRKVEVGVKLQVPFFDVDPMQVVWHGNYLKYFEIARQAFGSRSRIDIYTYPQENGFIFPVIRTSCKHVFPLRFGDEFICKAILREARIKLVFDFEIRLAADGKLCARGRSEQVALRYPSMEMELAIPDDVREALWDVESLVPPAMTTEKR
ncbi:MAG: acyl-CoA thioesterase [Pseudomonadota bacterium]